MASLSILRYLCHAKLSGYELRSGSAHPIGARLLPEREEGSARSETGHQCTTNVRSQYSTHHRAQQP